MSNREVKISSEKSFGIVFSLVFLLLFLYFLVERQAVYLWPLVVSIVFLILGFLAPLALKIPNIIWNKFGLLLGSFVAPIVLSLVYYLVVFPTGIAVRIFNNDLLKRKFDKGVKSYWIERKEPIGSMKNQF